MAEASAHSSGVRDVVCEDQSCEKNSAPSALSSLESVVDVDVSTGKNVSYADAGRPDRALRLSTRELVYLRPMFLKH